MTSEPKNYHMKKYPFYHLYKNVNPKMRLIFISRRQRGAESVLPIVLAAGYDVDDAAGHDPSGTGGGAKQRDCCKVLELGWWCFF